MTDQVALKIEKFFSNYRLHQLPKGQIIILSGDENNYVYYLIKGQVKQYDVSYRGDEVILNVFKPPAFFPMSLAINKTPNNYVYEAETDIEVRQAPAEEVIAFLKDNPDVVFDLLSRVYKGLDGLLGRMAHLMASNARDRLMYELLIEGRRFGEIQTDKSCLIKLNERDLAARAGLSRETINREIGKLKTSGLLKVRHGDMIIKSLAELEKKLGKKL